MKTMQQTNTTFNVAVYLVVAAAGICALFLQYAHYAETLLRPAGL